MENQGTQGVSGNLNFHAIENSNNNVISDTSGSDEKFGSGSDQYGIRHWPKLFDYLKENIIFSATIISIIGYIFIASFGQIKNIYQYVAYVGFLGLVLSFYYAEKNKKKFLFFLLVILLTLILIIFHLFWPHIVDVFSRI